MASHAYSTDAPDSGALHRSRHTLEARIEEMIALLDLIDGDSDLEPDACFELALQHEIRGGANVRAF